VQPFQLVQAIVATAVLCVSGCAQIPVAQLGQYRQAFSQAQEASEKVLLDYDQALKDARTFLRSRQAPALPAAPYPLTWNEALNSLEARVPDDIEARRLALKVVADYNEVLTQLAEGKTVDEVKAGASGLVSSIDKFVSVTKGAGIPGLSAITSIISTFVEYLEKARLREEFVQAIEKGSPIVEKIIDALIADIGTHYDARATLLNRERLRTVAAMRTVSETTARIAAQHNIPAADLDKLQKEVNDKLAVARSEIQTLPVKITGGGATSLEYSPVAKAQVEDEQRELARLGGLYVENLNAMKSLTSMLDQYRRLLQKTQSSLRALAKALKEPADVATSADELLGIAFSLRRDLEDLRTARANR